MPMNNPNSPPQLAKKSAIVNVSERLMAVKYDCLNEIQILLVEKLLRGNKVNAFYSIDDQIQTELRIYVMELLFSFLLPALSNGNCDHSMSYVMAVQSGKQSCCTLNFFEKIFLASVQHLNCIEEQIFVLLFPETGKINQHISVKTQLIHFKFHGLLTRHPKLNTVTYCFCVVGQAFQFTISLAV